MGVLWEIRQRDFGMVCTEKGGPVHYLTEFRLVPRWLSADEKEVTPAPAVAEIVVRSRFERTPGVDVQPGDRAREDALNLGMALLSIAKCPGAL